MLLILYIYDYIIDCMGLSAPSEGQTLKPCLSQDNAAQSSTPQPLNVFLESYSSWFAV